MQDLIGQKVGKHMPGKACTAIRFFASLLEFLVADDVKTQQSLAMNDRKKLSKEPSRATGYRRNSGCGSRR